MMSDMNRIRPYEGAEGYLLVWAVQEDHPLEQTCCELLARSGYRLWYPEGGSQALNQKLAGCCGVAALFSPRSVCSHDFRKLVTAAVLQHKPILAMIAGGAPLSPGMQAQLTGAVQVICQQGMSLPPSMALFHAAHGPENHGVQVVWRDVTSAKSHEPQQLWKVSMLDEDYERRLLESLQNAADNADASADAFIPAAPAEQEPPPAPPVIPEVAAEPQPEPQPSPEPVLPDPRMETEQPRESKPGGTVLIESQPPRLIVLDTGEIIDCLDGATTLGRTAERADVVLPVETVSAQHARILSVCTGEKDLRSIADCDSSNGTWINGQRLERGATVPIETETVFLSLGPKAPCLLAFGPAAKKLQPGVTILILTCIETWEDHLFLEGEMLLGRGNDWPRYSLSEPHISWHHACIRLHGGSATLADVGSANGTRLNGQRLTPHRAVPLQHGDQIRMGMHHFTVRILTLKNRAL